MNKLDDDTANIIIFITIVTIISLCYVAYSRWSSNIRKNIYISSFFTVAAMLFANSTMLGVANNDDDIFSDTQTKGSSFYLTLENYAKAHYGAFLVRDNPENFRGKITSDSLVANGTKLTIVHEGKIKNVDYHKFSTENNGYSINFIENGKELERVDYVEPKVFDYTTESKLRNDIEKVTGGRASFVEDINFTSDPMKIAVKIGESVETYTINFMGNLKQFVVSDNTGKVIGIEKNISISPGVQM